MRPQAPDSWFSGRTSENTKIKDMAQQFTPLAPDVYLFEDIANIYVIRHDDHGIAIDIGNGAWLSQLSQIRVSHLDWVLLTHCHPAQCRGIDKLDLSTRLIVPELESEVLINGEPIWLTFPQFHN
jgi:hypothetical protein